MNSPAIILSSIALLACLEACKPSPPSDGQPETTSVACFGSTGTVTLPELAEELGYLAPVRLDYKGNTFSGPQDIQAVISGNTDIGGAFSGSIVKLASAHAPIRAIVAGFGVDSLTWTGFFVREDSPLHEARDLIGKKVAMNTVGAHTEFMTREWLRRKGLTEEEIKQVILVSVPPASAEQLVRTGQVEVAALAGPIRDKALIKGGLRLLFSDRELYGDFTSGAYVVRKEFAKRNPNTTRKLATGIGKAIEWARSQPRDTVIRRLQAILARRGRNETDSIVRYWKSPGIIARQGRLKDADFQVWIDFLTRQGDIPAGTIHPSDIYTNAFNDKETATP